MTITILLRMNANKDTIPHVYSLFASVEVPFHCWWPWPSGWGKVRTPELTPNSLPLVGLSPPSVFLLSHELIVSPSSIFTSDTNSTWWSCPNSNAIDFITIKDRMGHDCVSVLQSTIFLLWCAMGLSNDFAFHMLQKIHLILSTFITIYLYIWAQYNSIIDRIRACHCMSREKILIYGKQRDTLLSPNIVQTSNEWMGGALWDTIFMCLIG